MRGKRFCHCIHEYKNLDNVYSGERSQEITFDFISAEAGIYRRMQTMPGHRYQIEAWGKHVRSQSPVELSLGVVYPPPAECQRSRSGSCAF